MTFLSLFLLVAPFFLELSFLSSLLWVSVSCLVNFIVNLIDHNHIHVPTFGYKTLNTIFGLLLTITRGASERFTFAGWWTRVKTEAFLLGRFTAARAA